MISHIEKCTQSKGQLPRVLLAGSTGFLGSILIAHLEQFGFEVIKIPRLGKIQEHKFQDPNNNRDLVLVNCIGITPGEKLYTREHYAESNVDALRLLIDEFGTQIRRFIHCSTWLTEANDKSNYVYSKIQAEQLVSKAAEEYGFESKILRLPTIWSKNKYKQSSLLHDLLKIQLNYASFEPKNKDAEIQIGTEDFFVGSVLSSILESAFRDDYWESETWHGTVVQLIEELSLCDSLLENQSHGAIKKLCQVLDHWKVTL
jgi:hypothetical protein